VKPDDQYASFLLRLWFDKQRGEWQLLLRSVQSGSEYRFNTLDHMVQFLESQMTGYPEDQNKKQGGQ